MMKTGAFKPNWHALSNEAGARTCLKTLFRKALDAFIEPRLFQGNSHERKRAHASSILDGLAEEIYRWDSIVEVKPATPSALTRNDPPLLGKIDPPLPGRFSQARPHRPRRGDDQPGGLTDCGHTPLHPAIRSR